MSCVQKYVLYEKFCVMCSFWQSVISVQCIICGLLHEKINISMNIVTVCTSLVYN